MAAINTVKETDTFETQRVQVNSVITKLNTITADADSMQLNIVSADPSDTVTATQALLYVHNASGTKTLRLKIGTDHFKISLTEV